MKEILKFDEWDLLATVRECTACCFGGWKTGYKINSSPKAVSGQQCPCPAWVLCDSSCRGAGQRPQRGQSPVEHRGNLSALIQTVWSKSIKNGPNPFFFSLRGLLLNIPECLLYTLYYAKLKDLIRDFTTLVFLSVFSCCCSLAHWALITTVDDLTVCHVLLASSAFRAIHRKTAQPVTPVLKAPQHAKNVSQVCCTVSWSSKTWYPSLGVFLLKDTNAILMWVLQIAILYHSSWKDLGHKVESNPLKVIWWNWLIYSEGNALTNYAIRAITQINGYLIQLPLY